MNKITLLMLFLVSSCSYVHYRGQQDIVYTQSYVHDLKKPLINIHPYFDFITISKKHKSYAELSVKEKMILYTLFPRVSEFSDKRSKYSLKKLVIKKESITNNLTPSIFAVFSIITFGIIPSYVTSSFLGHMVIVNNKTGKERKIHLRPKYIKGMGLAFALLSFRYDWHSFDQDPYRNNLSEYYQNYTLHDLAK
jgi:hypothetical protein